MLILGTAIGADYFGLFSDRMRERIAPGDAAPNCPAFVGIMSHGPSGDIWLRDYLQPAPKKPPHDISSYTDALVKGGWETNIEAGDADSWGGIYTREGGRSVCLLNVFAIEGQVWCSIVCGDKAEPVDLPGLREEWRQQLHLALVVGRYL